jgi:hypothetical protein
MFIILIVSLLSFNLSENITNIVSIIVAWCAGKRNSRLKVWLKIADTCMYFYFAKVNVLSSLKVQLVMMERLMFMKSSAHLKMTFISDQQQ